jgi:glycosyltransferase involved in cell wall biosynthesis
MSGSEPERASRPKLIFLVTEDWYFWLHRLPQARAARAAGFDVAVATRVRDHGPAIEGEGFRLHALPWKRGSTNPAGAFHDILAIRRLYRSERPDIVHHVSFKPILLGSVAALAAGVPAIVNAFTGLGLSFVSDSSGARAFRSLLLPAFGALMKKRHARFMVENADDRRTLVTTGLATEDRVVLIRGSGIDIERYRPLPEPASKPVVIAAATRMLRIKGVPALVEAYRILRDRGVPARLLLAGDADPENRASVSRNDLFSWATEPGVEWLGHVDDVRTVWAQAHIAVLPSLGGEGIPVSLMEAAACARPIVASDVPGCREITNEGENGFLVPPNDPVRLADALQRLVVDDELRSRFGSASRKLVESDLSASAVGERTVSLYRELLAEVSRP